MSETNDGASSGVWAIVLAAGAGSRFGGGKLLARFRGRPLIEHALIPLSASPVEETLVVAGAYGEELQSICERHGVNVVVNPDWMDGQSTSVRAGIESCGPRARAAVVLLGDQPLVGAEALERLIGAFERGAKVAVATYGGKRRNPALFAREVWPVLLQELSGDVGARDFLINNSELVTEVACDGVADPADVDTVEDLRRLEEISRRM